MIPLFTVILLLILLRINVKSPQGLCVTLFKLRVKSHALPQEQFRELSLYLLAHLYQIYFIHQYAIDVIAA
jgi:hypothetical protein